jgi:hypothetical protein
VNYKEKGGNDVQMTMGVACATLPTSSSFCMIFLIRAFESEWNIQEALSDTDRINEHHREAYNRELCCLVSIFHDGRPGG